MGGVNSDIVVIVVAKVSMVVGVVASAEINNAI